jgi:phage tail tape-measure protein
VDLTLPCLKAEITQTTVYVARKITAVSDRIIGRLRLTKECYGALVELCSRGGGGGGGGGREIRVFG